MKIIVPIILMLLVFTQGQTQPSKSSTPFSTIPSEGGATDKHGKMSFTDAQPEDITNENFPDMIDSFDYPNAEITDVVNAISKLTGKNFIIDSGVRGKISIVAPSPITKAEAYKAFLSALAINGMTVVPSGKFWKIRPASSARRDSIETYSGSYYPNSDEMITRIIHLKHITADEVNKNLRILQSKDGEISTYPQTNSVIVSDYGSNVERIMKILQQLDVPTFEEQLKVVQVKYAKAKELAELIDQIVNKGEKVDKRSPYRSSIPRFRGGNEGKTESYFVIPDDRTNALIIVGNQSGIEKILKLVKTLDYKLSADEAANVHVYYVKYGDAEAIASMLTGIAKESTTKQQEGDRRSTPSQPSKEPSIGGSRNVEPVFGGDIKVTADKINNSLIITASLQDYKQVESILRKIDIPRDQVYVEAIILELNASDNQSNGLNYYFFAPDGNGIARSGFTGQAGSLASLLDPKNDSGAILGFGGGSDVNVKVAGTEFKVKSVLGFINLIKQNANVNILSTPQIMALDNEDAEIEVGDKVPVSQEANTTTTGGTTTGTVREKVAIKLKIKPFISPDSDIIRMNIDQTVGQVSKETVDSQKLAEAALVTTERNIKTNIVLRSGDTAVLGGLMKDQEIESVSKVPLLGDIPILGWLFKSKQLTTKKVNLLIFISPKIIRNYIQHKQLLGQKINERIDFIKNSMGGRDPHGRAFEKVVKRTGVKNEINKESEQLNDETHKEEKEEEEPVIPLPTEE